MITRTPDDILKSIAAEIVTAVQDQLPCAALDQVMRQHTYFLWDGDEARIVAAHINAALSGRPEDERKISELLQQHACGGIQRDLAEAALWHATDQLQQHAARPINRA
ncbi:hypothetical protein [Mycobacteroides abscessus]|uniref:Uncharacterized protein n=1 Tax=Mycobacteroides abscessus TaxID=36809 RepID=A0A0U0ZS20_9MYCO|nr:hypothetical protein [Mycobacteroides abscessus]CPV65990.1 Uncharacterised protein [Mycobacteroides abscessus]